MRRMTALLAAVVLIITMLTGCSKPLAELSAAELLDLGEKYLIEMNYEQALVQFLKVIEIEPMNPRGYTGAAEAYTALGETDKAIVVLKNGLEKIPDDTEIQMLLDELQLSDDEKQFLDSLTLSQKDMLTALEKALYARDHESAWKIIESESFFGLRDSINSYPKLKQRFKSESGLRVLLNVTSAITAYIKPDKTGDGEYIRAFYDSCTSGQYSDDFYYSFRTVQYQDGIANGMYNQIIRSGNYGEPIEEQFNTGQVVNGYMHGEEITSKTVGGKRLWTKLTIYESGKIVPFETEIRNGETVYYYAKDIDTGSYHVGDSEYIHTARQFGNLNSMY